MNTFTTITNVAFNTNATANEINEALKTLDALTKISKTYANLASVATVREQLKRNLASK